MGEPGNGVPTISSNRQRLVPKPLLSSSRRTETPKPLLLTTMRGDEAVIRKMKRSVSDVDHLAPTGEVIPPFFRWAARYQYSPSPTSHTQHDIEIEASAPMKWLLHTGFGQLTSHPLA
jgi:hypothetical protein